MRKKLVVGNWKMNMLRNEAIELSKSIVERIGQKQINCDVVFAPPYTSLHKVHEAIINSKVELGAQDVFWEKSGAYTGEVSPEMLLDAGCKWVIVGHSERRHILNETNEEIIKKIEASLQNNLKVILCVGETEQERKDDKTLDVITQQLSSGLEGINQEFIPNIVVAYEPVWAIGTGNVATVSDIINVHTEINKFLTGLFGNDGNNISLLYGGSVSPENIEDVITCEFVDGVLVGGASLDAEKFTNIIYIVGA